MNLSSKVHLWTLDDLNELKSIQDSLIDDIQISKHFLFFSVTFSTLASPMNKLEEQDFYSQ